MFQNLQDKLDKALHTLKGKGQITEINVAETVKEVRRALVDADVSYKVAKDFTNTVKEKALGENVITSLNPGQLMVKIVHDELAKLMGGEVTELKVDDNPTIILIAGLQGSGKTTFSGKLANFLKTKKNKKVLLVAGDVYRPAAINQLQVLGEQIGVDVYADLENKNPVEIAQSAIVQAKQNGNNVIIVDTAGRLAIDEQMMDEIRRVHQTVNPTETLFVVDSMTGQDAVNVAESFDNTLDVTGVTLTKLDGDTRGGAALSIRSVTEKPIKFIGMSEKLDGLELFHPERMASRILGMGDVLSLIEKAQQGVDEEKAKELEKKMRTSSFTFDDFLEQLEQVKGLGSLDDLMNMIPGANKMKGMKNANMDPKQIDNVQAIIRSMTLEERNNPDILNVSRKRRIAKGSGRSLQEVNRLIKQFGDMKKMMKQFTGSNKKGKKGKRGGNPFQGMNLPF